MPLIDTIIAFLQPPNVSVAGTDKSESFEALLLCGPPHRVSFADAFIWVDVKRRKDKVIYSFEKRFAGEAVEMRTGAENSY